MGLGAVRPMLFAKPMVIDPKPTRNLNRRISFFFVWPITGQLFAPPNLWFLHMMDTEIKKMVTPRSLLLSDINQIHRKASGGVAMWCLAFFLASGLCRCQAAIPLQPFRPLGASLTTFALGYKELMCLCDSMIFEGDFM